VRGQLADRVDRQRGGGERTFDVQAPRVGVDLRRESEVSVRTELGDVGLAKRGSQARWLKVRPRQRLVRRQHPPERPRQVLLARTRAQELPRAESRRRGDAHRQESAARSVLDEAVDGLVVLHFWTS
jgi:hypothetical protein